MELDIIKLQTTWNDAASAINSNFAKIKAAFATVGTGGGGGLNEDELRLFLEQNGYTTENWVKLQKYLTAESADLFFARKEWVEQQIAGIDLSPYAKSTDVANTYATISALNTLEGKHDALRNEFDALSNLLSSDTTDYINTWNEVVAFLDGYKDESDLATILSGMNADISSRLLASDFESWKTNTFTPHANLVANHTTRLDGLDQSILSINTRIDGVDKTIEDHIAEFIAFRANFEITDNLILVRKNFASTEEVSAKGINQGTGGGGGSSYSRLDTWEGYDNNKAGYVLSAGLGYGLKVAIDELNGYDLDNRVRSIENSYVSKDAGGVVNGGLVVSSLAIAGGTSSQFLKADGSLDSTSYLPTSGGTLSRSGRDVLTIDTSDSYGPMYQISVKGKITGAIGHIPSESMGDYGLFISNADANTALLLASDRELYFSLDAARLTKDYTLLHSGNIVESVDDLNDTTMWRFFRATYKSANLPTDTSNYLSGISFAVDGATGYRHQLGGDYQGRLFYRHMEAEVWQDWKTIAFTDSNITGNAAGLHYTKAGYGDYYFTPYDYGFSLEGQYASLRIRSTNIYNCQVTFADNNDVTRWSLSYRGANNADKDFYLGKLSEDGAYTPLIALNYSSENVLIGTTNDNGSGAKLQVAGGITTSGTIQLAHITIDSGNDIYSDNGLFIQPYGSGDVDINYLGSKTILNRNGGNVLIGTTTDRGHRLTVGRPDGEGSLTSTTLNNSLLFVGMSDSTNSYGTNFWTDWSGNGFIQQGRTDEEQPQTYNLILQPFGGNIGIGTSSPSYKLDVIGDIRATESITIGGATLSWENGALKVNTSFYSEKEISAKGLSTGGGSGASYNRLDAWGDYDSSKAGYVLSAYLGNDLNTRLSSLSGVVDTHTSRISSLENAGYITSSALSGYLPTNGGTISNGIWAYQLNLNALNTDAGLRFSINGALKGLLRVDSNQDLWYQGASENLLLHTGNVGDYAITPSTIGSQSVAYAANAGSVAWDNVSGRPSVAIQQDVNNFIHNSNEFTFVPNEYNDVLWLNYRTTGGTNGNIVSYIFGNGKGGKLAEISNGQFSGNAATATIAESATKLATPRTIWGQSFDGTGNVDGVLYMTNNSPLSPEFSTAGVLGIENNTLYLGYSNVGFMTTINGRSLSMQTYDGVTRLLINSSGNVTIGASDLAGEDAKLFVDGESIFDGTIKALNTIRLYGRPNVSADTYLDNTTYAGLNIRDSSSSYMLIGSNVGIGTTSPQYKLHVAGTGYFSGALTAKGGLTVNGTLTVGGASIHPTANNPYFQLYQNNNYWYWQADNNYSYIGGTMSKALRIDQDGNTLIRGSLGVDALLTASNGLTVSKGISATDGIVSDWITAANITANTSATIAALTVSGLSTLTGGVVTNDISGNGQSLYLGNASNNAYIKVREDMVGSSSMWSIPRDGKATFTSLTTPTLSVTGSATIASVAIEAGNATLSNLTVNTVATLKQLVVGIDGMSCNAPATFNDFIYGSSITPRTDNYYVLGNNNYKWYAVTAYNVNVHDAITIEAGKELRFKDDNGVVHTLKYDSAKQAFVFDGNVNATGEISAKKLNA